MRLSREERECIMRRSEADDTWDVWAEEGVLRRMIENRGWKHSEEGPGFYRIPVSSIRILKANRQKRKGNPEALAAARLAQNPLQKTRNI